MVWAHAYNGDLYVTNEALLLRLWKSISWRQNTYPRTCPLECCLLNRIRLNTELLNKMSLKLKVRVLLPLPWFRRQTWRHLIEVRSSTLLVTSPISHTFHWTISFLLVCSHVTLTVLSDHPHFGFRLLSLCFQVAFTLPPNLLRCILRSSSLYFQISFTVFSDLLHFALSSSLLCFQVALTFPSVTIHSIFRFSATHFEGSSSTRKSLTAKNGGLSRF